MIVYNLFYWKHPIKGNYWSSNHCVDTQLQLSIFSFSSPKRKSKTGFSFDPTICLHIVWTIVSTEVIKDSCLKLIYVSYMNISIFWPVYDCNTYAHERNTSNIKEIKNTYYKFRIGFALMVAKFVGNFKIVDI